GHTPITLETLPGCFCHRRADMGGLALTEVVAELVAFDPGDRVMDLGCGCGMDGLLLATAFPDKRLRIDYQDSSAPARDSTLANLRAHPHASRFFFSAEGEGDPNAYDLLLANPPYFGDWRIAEFFIQTAHRLLKRGGLIAFVSKRAAKPTELLQAAHFDLLSATPRRGYTILLAQKR
ncbi:MAG: methyltransferase, partial [Candidatus Spyradenecus sp.]